MIEALEWEHFLSYQDRQRLTLANQGFVLVQGRNKLSNALDTNGVGKTGLFDAVSWCLFGQTLPRKDGPLRADDVACRFTSAPCVVTVSLKDDQGSWAVRRTRRPGALEVEGLAVTDKDIQAAILDRLGYGWNVFRHAVVFGQGAAERFAQAGQAEQMKMLDEIQGLDMRDWLERARTARSRAETILRELTSLVLSWSGRLVQMREQERELAQAEASYAERRSETMAMLSRTIGQWGDAINQGGETISRAMRSGWDVTKWERKRVAAATATEIERTDAQAVAWAQQRLTQAQDMVKDFDARLEKLIAAGRCPTCYTSIQAARTSGLFGGERAELMLEVKKREAVWQLATDSWAVSREAQGRALKDYDTDAHQRAIEAGGPGVLGAALKAVRTASMERERLEVQWEQTRDAVWEGAQALATLRGQIRSAETELATCQAETVTMTRRLALAEYWCEAFGDRGIRSLMLDGVSDFLNDRLAVHLAVLAGGEARSTVSSLKALKSGGTRERLTVTTVWDWGADGAGSSAGQGRREDLALFQALQDVAAQRSSRPFGFRVWDEAGDALDPRGRELFLEWVTDQARTTGSGFLITHSADMAALAEPDATWTVVLDENGSHVKVS